MYVCMYVFLKIDTRSHGLEKQNAIDMQTQSAKRNKNSSSRHSPFYKGPIHIDKPYLDRSVSSSIQKKKMMGILNSGHIRFLIMRVLNK